MGLVLAGARTVSASDGELLVKTFAVTVVSDQPAFTQDQPLRVFKVNDGPLPLMPVVCKSQFDETGNCRVDLPAGTYRFEVLSSAQIRMLVAIHTPAVVVNGAATVKLKSTDLGELSLQADKDLLDLGELGVRSIGPADEAVQMAGRSSKIHFIANADEPYNCRFIATNADESQTFVGWEMLKASPHPRVVVHKSAYNVCTFEATKDLPFAGSIVATLLFPTSQLEWPADPAKKLFINRDFLSVSYHLSNDDGRLLQFLPIGYALQRKTSIKLGGKLKVSGFAEPILTKENDGEGNRLFWVVSLTDPAGHVVDETTTAMLNLKTMASLDNDPWTTASPYQSVDAAKLKNLNTRLRLRVTSDLAGFKDLMVPPGPFVVVASSKYSLRIPGAWAFRGRLYLAKLERMNAACRLATGRKGPAQVNINWRINFNDAWAIVGNPAGGDRGIWMSMQMNGLAADDLFQEPWALTHEMMHNFGFGHGPPMNHAIDRALFLFNLGRWQAWDNRASVP